MTARDAATLLGGTVLGFAIGGLLGYRTTVTREGEVEVIIEVPEDPPQ